MEVHELFKTPFLAPYKGLFKIFSEWEKVVGEYAKKSEPLFIDDKKLLIRADDEFIMTELHFVKEEIKERVNTLLGEKAVEEVKIICRKAKPGERKTVVEPVHSEIPREIRRILERIDDPVMREKLERFCLRMIEIRLKREVELKSKGIKIK